TDDHDIGSQLWNEVHASLADRLSAVETAADGFEDAVSNAAIAAAQALLANAVAPQIENVQDLLTAIETAIGLAEDRLQALQTGGVVATNVTLSAIAGLTSANVQAAFAEVVSLLADEVTARNDAIAAIQMLPAEALLLSANANLVAGKAYRIITAGITLTLPANPAAGASIRLIDGGVLSYTTATNVARNGKTIMGLAEDLNLNVPGLTCLIWYNGTTWMLQ
ncbi:hypothetical protein, partial [Rhizobium sp. FKY42]|uniref:hypothetical protein n=1 Tax=Rhizobium sp. FKY42 TaxID=2562310 RepID=UPI00198169EF